MITDDLKKYYDKEMSFSISEFYKTNYDFCQEIETENHLQEFLSEFLKCYNFYEKEVFPKLLDIQFLAEYVGSVPFERKSEIAVGGQFPVHLFKKVAILKWGNHSRYNEYKLKTEELINLYGLEYPEEKQEVQLYKENFESLINHLESEPNPFV